MTSSPPESAVSRTAVRRFTVSRLGRLCGVSRSTLLYYDRIGLLRPSARSSAGYRLYGQEERERLEKILLLHSTGIPLDRIRRLLDAPDQRPTALLARQLMEINARIDELKNRQRIILDLLEEEGSLAGAKRILKTFADLGREAGIVRGNYLKIHRLFEKSSPDMHRRLLRFLGFTEREISLFVKRLKVS